MLLLVGLAAGVQWQRDDWPWGPQGLLRDVANGPITTQSAAPPTVLEKKLPPTGKAPPPTTDAIEPVKVQLLTNTFSLKFVLIPAGTFKMGSPKDEEGRFANEKQHDVEITRSFFMGIHPVTVGQFGEFVRIKGYETEAEKDGEGGWGWNDTFGKFEGRKPIYSWKTTGWTQTAAHPVVNVTWNDAVAFCDWLSQQEGKKYRLPTEAEWEYCCRAKTTTRFWSGDRDEDLKGVANIADTSFKAKYSTATSAQAWDDGYPFTSPVGQFRANGFGLYDMHGNVWQWCSDWYETDYHKGLRQDPQGASDGEFRMVRGGSFDLPPRYCRSAYRYYIEPARRDFTIGFRVVLVR
jgi:formylglycine-generating enzyme required for sulfatase activity